MVQPGIHLAPHPNESPLRETSSGGTGIVIAGDSGLLQAGRNLSSCVRFKRHIFKPPHIFKRRVGHREGYRVGYRVGHLCPRCSGCQMLPMLNLKQGHVPKMLTLNQSHLSNMLRMSDAPSAQFEPKSRLSKMLKTIK